MRSRALLSRGGLLSSIPGRNRAEYAGRYSSILFGGGGYLSADEGDRLSDVRSLRGVIDRRRSLEWSRSLERSEEGLRRRYRTSRSRESLRRRRGLYRLSSLHLQRSGERLKLLLGLLLRDRYSSLPRDLLRGRDLLRSRDLLRGRDLSLGCDLSLTLSRECDRYRVRSLDRDRDRCRDRSGLRPRR